MNAPIDFQIAANHATCRLTGPGGLDELIAQTCQAIADARAQQITRLLVDTTGLTGITSLSTFDRYAIGERLAAAAESRLTIVFVARAELIEPQKFGITVARNRGLIAEAFTTEAEALAWLLKSESR